MALESARQALQEQALENEKTKAEIALIKAEEEQVRVFTALKDEEVTIQAANAATGAAKVKLGDKQDETNRLKIMSDEKKERIKAKVKTTTKG
jgi:hypothetical protein